MSTFPAHSQAPATNEGSRATIEAEYDAAFQEVLRDPGNLDKSFRFAELAVRVGDYEGAVSALERMLILNPSLRRVRLELGVLYFRLGSYAIARSYLESAVEGEDVPPQVRERVGQFLAEIDKRLEPGRIAGTISAGVRYQTNANSGPGGTGVRLFGAPAELDQSFTGQDDYNAFAAVNLRHRYDFGTQTHDALESDFTAYRSKQFEQNQVNLGFVEATSGPRLALLPDLVENATIRPYGLLTYVHLGSNELFTAYGGGVNATKQITQRLATSLNYQMRNRRFRESSERPTAHDNTGLEHEGVLDTQFALSPGTGLNLRGRITRQDSRESFIANTERAVLAGISQSYDAPLAITPRRWQSAFSTELQVTSFDDPDPVVDPGNRRVDRRWNFRFLTSIPLTQDLSVVLSAGHSDVASSIPNFTFRNSSGSIAGVFNF